MTREWENARLCSLCALITTKPLIKDGDSDEITDGAHWEKKREVIVEM